MTSLRDELTGAAQPAARYTLLCPPGWSRVPPAVLTDESTVRPALDAMKRAGRADLVLQFRSMLSQLRTSLQERGVFEVYAAPATEDGVPLPAMLAVSPLVIPAGVTWDQALARLAKGRPVEAAAGEAELHLIRSDSRFSDDAATVQSRVLTYVAPVPGGDGRRALLFQYTVLTVDDEDAAQLAEGLVFVGEAIMSTLRWTAAA